MRRTSIVELSEYVFEPLREDEEFLLYEGHPRQSEATPVLLLAFISIRPELESIKKIEHEYSSSRAWQMRRLPVSSEPRKVP